MKHLILVLTAVCLLCLLPCALADEEPFAPQGDYRVFCDAGHYGVQTLDGETVIPAQFAGIQPFTGDLCMVEGIADEEACLGLWRLSTKEELLPCDYENIEITGTMVITSSPYSDQHNYGFRINLFDPETKLWVMKNEEGTSVWSHEDGRYFSLEYKLPTGDRVNRLIAPDGTLLLDADLWGSEDTETSHGIATIVKADLGFFEYYNTVTNQLFQEFYDLAWPFADGYAAVCPSFMQGDYYVIDETGAAVTPPYQSIVTDNYGILQYGQGLFAVRQEDGWYVIRVSTETEPDILLGPVQCSKEPQYLGHQVFALPVDDGILVFSGANGCQKTLAGMTVHDTSSFTGCSAIIYKDGKAGFLFDDLSVIEPVYDDCVEFLGDYGFVEINGLWYPIDRNGQVNTRIAYPIVAVSDDCTYYVIEYQEDNVLCLSPALEPISHRSFCGHG